MSEKLVKRVIITADDLGIDKNINKGIIESFKNGLLKSTALLMNAPETEEGIQLARQNPGLETGIHLSIVEGMSLRGIHSTITDSLSYFNGEICLIRDWKNFLKKYFLGKIEFRELEEELELQIQQFLRHFTEIHFLNGTQHMHLMPKVWKIVIKLAKKYNVKAIRLPGFARPSKLWLNKRLPFLIPFQLLGERGRADCRKAGIKYPHDVMGMQFSGKTDESKLLLLLQNMHSSTAEIVMHPGYESMILRKNLPWAYSTFDWDSERKAVQSETVKKYIQDNQIKLIHFSEL
ncbi:MAG: ChbG/HpnK family deacetylase [Bacteroidales bacterium]|nr:ChbG/HpnK family deacetylase [Bacteroidales bacterium]